MATDPTLLLERCEAALKDASGADDQDEGDAQPPAAVMVPYLMDSRKKLKMTQLQLSVLDRMLLLLEKTPATELLSRPPVPQPARGTSSPMQLAALKEEYTEGVKTVERLSATHAQLLELAGHENEKLRVLLSGAERRKAELVEQQRAKEREELREEKLCSMQLQELERSLLVKRQTLQRCERDLADLTAQAEGVHAHLEDWTRERDGLQGFIQALMDLTGYRLLAMGSQELRLEVEPQVHRPDLVNLKPLPLSLTWTPDGLFTIQSQEAMGVLDGPIQGPLAQVSSTLQEIMQRYLSQGEMLAEIQDMHSRFAIDWRPAQRLLVFLKSASVVCHLNVGEGYPSRGSASLVSVRGEKGPVNIDALQPPQANPSLTEWLEYLTSCPDI